GVGDGRQGLSQRGRAVQGEVEGDPAIVEAELVRYRWTEDVSVGKRSSHGSAGEVRVAELRDGNAASVVLTGIVIEPAPTDLMVVGNLVINTDYVVIVSEQRRYGAAHNVGLEQRTGPRGTVAGAGNGEGCCRNRKVHVCKCGSGGRRHEPIQEGE